MIKKELILVIVGVIILSVLIFLSSQERKVSSDYDFKVYFFNAGKADAILLEKNNHYILIDTGEDNLGDDILRYFNRYNITKLDYLIITHFDKDHVGSASTIIDNIEIMEVLQSNSPKESEYYTAYLNSLENKSLIPTTVTGDYELNFEDLEIVVNGPGTIYEKNESNNSSLIVSVNYKNTNFLFMGDSENLRIKDFISINDKTYDFIKIPYHGNYLKQLSSLLDSTKPKYGIMTCSNFEGCEDKTLELLDNHSIKYYMTKNGAISLYSNGEDIIIKQ